MVSIRLSRIGKKNHPVFRILVQDKHKDPFGPALAIVGFYDPHTDPATVRLERDEILAWIKKGAQPTNTVWNLLVSAGVVEGKKRKSVTISKERAAKLAEAKAAKEEEKKAAAEKPAEAPKKEAAEAKSEKQPEAKQEATAKPEAKEKPAEAPEKK